MTAIIHRHKPTIVHTIRWTGSNERELIDFTHGRFDTIEPEDRVDDPEETAQLFTEAHSVWVGVRPGQHIAKFGDGDFRVLDDQTLAEDYEPVIPGCPATAAGTANPALEDQ